MYAQEAKPAGDRPATTLESCLHSAARELDDLQVALDRLHERMHNVLQPEVQMPPAPGTSAQGAATNTIRVVDQPHSMVVNELGAISSRIQSMTIYVNGLAGRCEA